MIFLYRNGRWPNDVNDGVYPPDFAGYIPNYTFLTGPGMGGVWDWNGIGATLPHYGIAVRAMNTVTDLIDLFQEVANQADDGNPATGSIQIVVCSTNSFLQFILETR